jgi:PPOX class probable F420-dependent enzyme
MGAVILSEQLTGFLAAPNPAVIATLHPDGHPVTVATWYLLDGERILVNMDAGRKRVAWLRDDPRVSLTVLAQDSWYSHLSLQGQVVEWRDDEGLSDIDRISRHYGGQPYPVRTRPRVSAWIEVERAHAWGPKFRG